MRRVLHGNICSYNVGVTSPASGTEAAWLAGEARPMCGCWLRPVRRRRRRARPGRGDAGRPGQDLALRAVRPVRAYWSQLAGPEGTDRSAEARVAARWVHLSPVPQTWGATGRPGDGSA